MLLILRIIVRNRRVVLVLGVLIRAGRKGICMARVARVSWAREGSQGHGGSGTRDWLVLVIDAQSRQGVCGVVFLLILRREPVGHGKRRKMMVPITSINYSNVFYLLRVLPLVHLRDITLPNSTAAMRKNPVM
jgi:hypothetical protein